MPAAQPIVMPKLGLTMTEGVLAEWKIAPGDLVKAGEVIFLVETDKISNEIEAEADAVVESLHVAEGDVVPVGEVVAMFRTDGEADDAAAPAAASPPRPRQAPSAERTVATPLARRLAADAGIAIGSVVGSGPRGRIMADDVTAAIEISPPPGPAPREEKVLAPAATTPGTLRPLGQYQQVTARRLTEAKRDIPHFYVMSEADVTELLDMRERLNRDPAFAKLTVNHFIIAGLARALAIMPEVNAVWTEGGVLQLHDIDVGLAVEGPKGLVAPVLHDIGALALDEVAAAASALVERARAGRLSMSDSQGGGVSVSNVGMFGVTGLVPIINPGQSAILGVGRNVARFLPDEAGRPVLRQVLNLTLSCDHRVMDGALAARFLNQIQRNLEAPLSLLRRMPQGTAS